MTVGSALGDLELAMASTPMLGATDAAAVAALAAQGTLRTHPRGSVLFHQEDGAKSVYFLHVGRVEMTSLSADGARALHTTLEPPQFFGEIGVLGDTNHSVTAVAVEDSIVWTIDAAGFLAFLAEQPAAARGLLRAMARQIRAHEALVDDLLFLDLKGRVAKRLLGLVSPSFDELPEDGALVPAVVTHSDLASLAGGTRESVTRVLSDLQRRGIVAREGRRYVLQDIKALARLAGL
jgi:CRP/FNR family transcriptional regulator/CRP/FNR family cyclic AMP-dependent transcriptional regulator